MSEGLSLRGYARYRRSLGLPGGTLEAVRKAALTGRITLRGGKVFPAEADPAWTANTRRPPTVEEVEAFLEGGSLEAMTDALAADLSAASDEFELGLEQLK